MRFFKRDFSAILSYYTGLKRNNERNFWDFGEILGEIYEIWKVRKHFSIANIKPSGESSENFSFTENFQIDNVPAL